MVCCVFLFWHHIYVCVLVFVCVKMAKRDFMSHSANIFPMCLLIDLKRKKYLWKEDGKYFHPFYGTHHNHFLYCFLVSLLVILSSHHPYIQCHFVPCPASYLLPCAPSKSLFNFCHPGPCLRPCVCQEVDYPRKDGLMSLKLCVHIQKGL